MNDRYTFTYRDGTVASRLTKEAAEAIARTEQGHGGSITAPRSPGAAPR